MNDTVSTLASMVGDSVDTVHFKYFYNVVCWYVYILKYSNTTYYTGCPGNLEDRLIRHSKGQVHYTKDKLPVELITYIAFKDKHKAFEFEKYLKSGSGIAFRNKRLI